ncbi:UDP-glucuronosyltransferase 1A9-like [Sitodiplosis mosellana]|uniref:UDP-glucuronosyltransferase 1A9-like n=1 Tax=Sitodiplosis mosellana TaxID=263140 RepID=UPI0024445203|nr:UDP-glucuronosyltransferase 1A9-like [Sitodiplosis mosellana]
MHLAEQKGFGISIPIETLTADKISTAVRTVLSVPSYAEQAKIISDQYRDQPLTPLETGMHWVKHVTKNKGAPHLKSVAVDLPFYKLYNLDVWAFIFGVIAFCVFLLIKFITALVAVTLIGKTTQKVKKS